MEEGKPFGAEAEDSPLNKEELCEDDHCERYVDENNDVRATPVSEDAASSFGIGFSGKSPTGAHAD